MGKRGFSPQPAEVAKAKGLYRPSRHGQPTENLNVEFLSAVPEVPKMLNEVGADFWRGIIEQLLKTKGLVAIQDLPSFQLMAYQFQVIMECDEKISREGRWMYDDKGNQKEHPAQVTIEKATKTFINLSREFGCTPSARNRLSPTGSQSEKEADKYADLKL